MDTECANEKYIQEDGSWFRIQILRNEGAFKVFIDLFQNESEDSLITSFGPNFLKDLDGITNCDLALKKQKRYAMKLANSLIPYCELNY